MHAGLKPNRPFRRRDPLLGPALHRFPTQKPHFLYKPILGRVRLHQASIRIPDSPDNRSHSIAKLRMDSKKRQKGFVTQFRRRHSQTPSFAQETS
jgi:hypothetical protein